MRSVIVCEGRDDLWFISYYLHKALKWDECDASLWCKSYNLSAKSGQKVFYMTSPDEKHHHICRHHEDDTGLLAVCGGAEHLCTLLTISAGHE